MTIEAAVLTAVAIFATMGAFGAIGTFAWLIDWSLDDSDK
jgi:hypothetical protein